MKFLLCFFLLQGITFFSECVTWQKVSCQCEFPLLFERSVKIVLNMVHKKGNRPDNQVLSYFSEHRSDANNLKILGRFTGLLTRSWASSKWQPEMQLYNRMSVWISPAAGKRKLMRRNLSWKESYGRWQRQQKSWHRAVTQSGVPDFHQAEARQRKQAAGLLCVAFLSEILWVIRG